MIESQEININQEESNEIEKLKSRINSIENSLKINKYKLMILNFLILTLIYFDIKISPFFFLFITIILIYIKSN